eukprot:6524517-Pyramimonas_sp.AAC.2
MILYSVPYIAASDRLLKHSTPLRTHPVSSTNRSPERQTPTTVSSVSMRAISQYTYMQQHKAGKLKFKFLRCKSCFPNFPIRGGVVFVRCTTTP